MLKTGAWELVFCLVAGWGVVSAGGCGRKGQAPAAMPAVQPTAVSAAKPSAGPIDAVQPGGDAGSESSSGGGEADKAGESAAIVEAPSSPAASKERVLLLAPTNPIIVEFQLSIDGQPHAAALEKLVDEVLKIADTDGDGRTMWKELCASKRIKYGQYGNLAIDGDNSEKQIVDRYDIARDGVVSRAELPRFLTRNAGGSRPFSVRGTLNYRDLNRRGAATWRVIDADEDGVISASERATATMLLVGRDSDDDEILVASDLNPRLQSLDPEMMRERRRRGADAVRLLGPHADWSNVQVSLEQEYGSNRALRADSFPLTPELFGQLDKNKDGRVRRDEFKALDDVPAHVVIAAEFGNWGSGAGEAGRGPRLNIIYADPALGGGSGGNVVEQPGRLTFSVGGTLLTFYTNDTVASDDFSARAKQALDMLDQNKDGYLESSEVPETLQGQLGRFEAVDADEDGKAYAHEIEAFLAQQQAGLRAQIHARATDSPDVLFAALDADHDERLDSREIEGAGTRLAGLDRNGDGQLTSDELPEVLLIGLARGSLENAEATFAPPPVIARGPDAKAPKWFAAMDANRDGVISKREFLGAGEQFVQLDANGNGLLEVGEVAK